jgi:trehalose 6-phosphate synthase
VSGSFVVVANRLPVDEVRPTASRRAVIARDGGLAAQPGRLVPRCTRSWPPTAAPGSAGRRRRPRPAPFEVDGIRCTRSPLEREVEEYYEGQSNATIWPLYHDAVETPVYHRHWREAYREVNQRFAEATDQVAPTGATVWVQDYQLSWSGHARERRPGPADRLLPAHPVPADRAVHADAAAGEVATACSRRPGRVPAAVWPRRTSSAARHLLGLRYDGQSTGRRPQG